MNLARSFLAAGCAAMAMCSASPLLACVPLPITTIADPRSDEEREAERLEALRQCQMAHQEKASFLASVERGERSNFEVRQFVGRITGGYHGCYRDRTAAFHILNAQHADLLSEDINSGDIGELNRFLSGNEKLITSDRAMEISAALWLRTFTFTGPKYWSEEGIRAALLEPDNWQIALQHLDGTSTDLAMSLRANWMFLEAINPQSAYFDPDLATHFAERTSSKADDILLANLLMQDGATDDDLLAAEKLLGWYSPWFLPEGAGTFASAKARMGRLAQLFTNSANPALRQRGEEQSNRLNFFPIDQDMHSEISEHADLGDYSSIFPEVDFSEPRIVERIGENFPNRAIRREVGGFSQAALLFDAEGNFESIQIIRSSGEEVLNRAAIRVLDRYVRPRLRELELPGRLAGSPAFVTLPEIIWRLSDDPRQTIGGEFRDGRLFATARMIDFRSMCL